MMMMMMIIIIIIYRLGTGIRTREPPAGRKRLPFGAAVLNLSLPLTVLVTKFNPQPTLSTNLPEGIKCTTLMVMENEVNRASGTASGLQHITCAGYLGTG
jgi:hypothetical protein